MADMGRFEPGDRMIIKLAMMAAVCGVMLLAPSVSALARAVKARRNAS
jgi:hypothetical protein